MDDGEHGDHRVTPVTPLGPPPGGRIQTMSDVRRIADEFGLSTSSDRMPERTFPVVEVFGPTVQGEGPDAGRPCWFVRLGGCDYRCTWCDSMHAVDPALVRKADRLTAMEIAERLHDLGLTRRHGSLVILSGGNPALHHAQGLVHDIHALGARVAVETQGTRFRSWLHDVDRLVISPKPPSSGMHEEGSDQALARFMELAMMHEGRDSRRLALKVVCDGSDADYEFARRVHQVYWTVPFYVSVMTPQGSGHPAEAWTKDTTALRSAVGNRYRDLCERVANDPAMGDVVVLPQLHVIAWGAKAGV